LSGLIEFVYIYHNLFYIRMSYIAVYVLYERKIKNYLTWIIYIRRTNRFLRAL